jgi:hypothetical protein
MDSSGVIVRAHDEGERRWFYGGGLHTWKATAEETNGAFLFFEDHMQQGKMTPLHFHGRGPLGCNGYIRSLT